MASQQRTPHASRYDLARQKIEQGFAIWGRLAFRFRWWILAAIFSLTAVLAGGLPLLKLHMSTDSFLSHEDSARVDYDNYRREFMSER